jgi:anti-sigma regulatory factor (Ser/Thr protein kinase)
VFVASDSVFRHEFPVRGGDFTHGGDVSCQIKELLKEIGLDSRTVRRAAIASYEAEMNIIMYAWQGRVKLAVSRGEIRITVDDEGPGIPDIRLAMTEGWSTATPEMRELGFGAGMGLPNIKKNSDKFRITSKVGRGTHLEMKIQVDGGAP